MRVLDSLWGTKEMLDEVVLSSYLVFFVDDGCSVVG